MKWTFIIILIIIISTVVRNKKKKQEKLKALQIPADELDLQLSKHVLFYQRLKENDKKVFRERVQAFLNTITITPVSGVVITELDRLYVAASSIIPIFHFPNWSYINLDEVLIYPGNFTEEYNTTGDGRNVEGMVGDGAMHRMMILSLPALREGFEQQSADNTGIHEFVHLLDKTDGATDGVPSYLIPKEMIAPWIKYMHQAINDIRHNHSDIRSYAGTNEAEFFAVISEYFFQRPEFLQAHHPELYTILEKTYRSSEK